MRASARPILSSVIRVVIIVTVVCAAALLCAAAPASPVPGQFVWTQTADPTTGWDGLRFSAPGPGGTLYAAGNAGDTPSHDIWVVKYDAAGTQLWSHAWDGPAGFNDFAAGIAVDGDGNLYVCGRATRAGNFTDAVLLKYSAAGALQWAKVWVAGATFSDEAEAVGLDAAGNVYVAGWKATSLTARTLWAAKCDPATGDRLWTVDHPRAADLAPGAIAVTAAGACYVAGSQETAVRSGIYDAVLWKVTAAGSSSWAKAWNGPRGGSDEWSSVALSPKGGVIVAGDAHEQARGDFAVASYAAGGRRRWARTWSSPGSWADECLGLAVSGNGSAWVAGFTDRTGGHGWADLVKWSASGTRLFARTMGTYTATSKVFAEFRAVTVDGNGNAYVAGSMDQAGGARQFLAAKYASAGRLVWRSRSGFVAPSVDVLETLCLGPAGYLYAAGTADREAEDARGVVVKIRR